MNEALFAKVAVENAVYHFDKLFTYRVPEHLRGQAVPGARVSVPFGAGNRRRVGLVFSLSGEGGEKVKDIDSVLDREPALSPPMLELARWLKERYYCTLFEAAKLMIPTGYHLRLQDSCVLSPEFRDYDRENYTETQWRAILFLRGAGKSVPLDKLAQETGLEERSPELEDLLARGVLCKVNTATSRVGDATSKMVRPVPGYEGKLTSRQRDVYQTLLDCGEASEKELCYFTGASASVVRALVDKGAAEAFAYEVYRRPDLFQEEQLSPGAVTLSPAQEQALQGLLREYHNPQGSRSALLYGVTGSGKTSVFLKLIQHVREQGKGVIVMVPEISLTAQTIRQFRCWFGDGMALFHSGLSLGERPGRVEAGPPGGGLHRGGHPLGGVRPCERTWALIVIDEEQEHTYQFRVLPPLRRPGGGPLPLLEGGGLLPVFLGHALGGDHPHGPGEEDGFPPAGGALWPGGAAPGGAGGHEPGRPAGGDLLWGHPGPGLAGELPRGPAVHFAAEPPGLPHLRLLQNLPRGGQLPPLQHLFDLPQRQRPADVPLLRLLRALLPPLPLLRQRHRHLPGGGHPAGRGTAPAAAARGPGAPGGHGFRGRQVLPGEEAGPVRPGGVRRHGGHPDGGQGPGL